MKKAAQEQAEEAYVGFIKLSKYIAYGSLLFLLIFSRCNFGYDGKGGTGNPDLYPEYLERMGISE